MTRLRSPALGFALALAACSGGGDTPTPTAGTPTPAAPTPSPTEAPEPLADVYADHLGDPIPGLDEATLALFHRGREVLVKAFKVSEGLGPTFNTDSCAGCHQFPAAGGSAPRYRDFFLVYQTREDGALVPVGTNGRSPVRNLYAAPPAFHIPEPTDGVIYARRNVPPGFGVGLFAFIADDDILAHADPDDADGDGISGRPNYEQGRVGRFGYKSQAFNLESFNRGASLNQMGLTTNPLFYTFPEAPTLKRAPRWPSFLPGPGLLNLLLKIPSPFALLAPGLAFGQVGAPDEPVFDDDGAPDPEMSDEDQLALLIFSTYLAAPRPAPLDATAEAGKALFHEVGCASCHIPTLPSTLGALPAYSDLLIHDMGPDLADGAQMGVAKGDEFRTQPLWGVSLHGPYLHDGRADSLADAIEAHGGEGEGARDAWRALSASDQAAVLTFLACLGGTDHASLGQDRFEHPQPAFGDVGGPDADLSGAALEQWKRGRVRFDADLTVEEGLGEAFNADSCRSCHQDPVIGGAGGLDTNVLRIGGRDEDGAYVPAARSVLPRQILPGEKPLHLPAEANLIEGRNPPSLLGIGALDRISEAAILAAADPDDLDGDGISGRARALDGEILGRFGWKAQVPTSADFVADALLNELGATIDPHRSTFTVADDGDAHADPEMSDADYDDLSYFVGHIAPPARKGEGDAELIAEGEALFAELGCASCHLPSLDGVPAYTDLLLHRQYDDASGSVEQDPGVEPGEYRTPPLWGVSDTGPWLHDGRATTLGEAIAEGHGGEASASREAWEALEGEDRAALTAFLADL